MACHRLFTHRSFKVTRGLKLAILAAHTSSGQYSIYRWSQIHRLHHKFDETHRDPINIKRGIFFGYVGQLFYPMNADLVKEWGRIDMRDFEEDKDLMFQYK
jgi:stearoyl-CoA desaturase (Delta-9 desaturase)